MLACGRARMGLGGKGLRPTWPELSGSNAANISSSSPLEIAISRLLSPVLSSLRVTCPSPSLSHSLKTVRTMACFALSFCMREADTSAVTAADCCLCLCSARGGAAELAAELVTSAVALCASAAGPEPRLAKIAPPDGREEKSRRVTSLDIPPP